MSITDELREYATNDSLHYCSDYLAIADRIDAEMVELPNGADGEPIHVDDLVYLDNGRRACVTEIDIMNDRESIICWDFESHKLCHPSDITHERPDSLKRIVEDIETFGIDAAIDNATRAFLVKIQGRICKIAKESGHE